METKESKEKGKERVQETSWTKSPNSWSSRKIYIENSTSVRTEAINLLIEILSTEVNIIFEGRENVQKSEKIP